MTRDKAIQALIDYIADDITSLYENPVGAIIDAENNGLTDDDINRVVSEVSKYVRQLQYTYKNVIRI